MMTAATIQEVFQFIVAERFFEDILQTYLSNKKERDEFRGVLWEQIISIKPEKLLAAWNNNWFKYLYLRIVKNQIISSNSTWHNKYRKYQQYESIPDYEGEDEFEANLELLENSIEETLIQKETLEERRKKLKAIDKAIKGILERDPHLLPEIDLFKQYYFEQKTYRDISASTNIPLMSVYQYIQNAEVLIKGHIINRQK